MNKYQDIWDIYHDLTRYEKAQLQSKRRQYEQKRGIRFMNLPAYIYLLAMQTRDNHSQNQQKTPA